MGKYRGLHLWIDDKNIQYQAKIWHDFKGITFRKLVDDKVMSTKVVRASFSGLDYATAFVLLRAQFNIN